MNLVKISSINIWDEEWKANSLSISTGAETGASNTICSKNYCECLPNTDYYLKCGEYSNRFYMGIVWYDANYSYISGIFYNANAVTSPSNARYFKITTNTSSYVYGNTYNNDIQICLNSEAEKTIYHPHWVLGLNNGNAITCDLSAMLPSGIGVVDLGSLNWNRASTSVSGEYRHYTNISGFVGNDDLLCTDYLTLTNGETYSQNNGVSFNSGTRIDIFDSRYKTVDDATFKNAMSGVLLFYKKA